MNLSRAQEHARNARTLHQAAKLHNDIDYELAMGEHSPEHEREGELALQHLQHRFPGVQEKARDVETPPSLSHNARRKLDVPEHNGRRRRGTPESKPPAAKPPATPRARRQPARSSGSPARRAAAAVSSIGDTGGWADAIGDMFVWGMALSIFYLLLTKAAAAGKLFEGAATVVRAVVSPVVDPLNPRGAV